MKTAYIPVNILKALGLVAAVTSITIIARISRAPTSGPQAPLTPKGLDLAVSRFGKTWVSELDEDRQGSILKAFDPDAPTKFDEETYLPPNQKIRIKLTWTPAAVASLASATLEEGPFYPAPDKQGLLRIYDGSKLVKDFTTRSVSLINRTNAAKNRLAQWKGSKELLVEARRTGTTLLSFKTVSTSGEAKIDKVRVTAVINEPYKGRILFVRAGATPSYNGNNPAFDDYLNNASPTLAEAIAAAPNESNIVIGPGTYNEHGLIISKPMLLTGLGGNYDDDIDTTNFNLDQAPIVDGQNQGRVLQIKNMWHGGMFTMSGLRVRGGGMSDDNSAGIDISCGEFS